MSCTGCGLVVFVDGRGSRKTPRHGAPWSISRKTSKQDETLFLITFYLYQMPFCSQHHSPCLPLAMARSLGGNFGLTVSRPSQSLSEQPVPDTICVAEDEVR